MNNEMNNTEIKAADCLTEEEEMKSKNPVIQYLYQYGIITLGCAIYAL